MNREMHEAADQAMARRDLPFAIAVLDAGLQRTPDDFDGWMKLAALRRATEQPQAALDATNAALAARPNAFMALLLKGTLHEQLHELGRAAEIYRAVLFHAAREDNLPSPIIAQVNRIRGFLAAYRASVEARLKGAESLDPQHVARADRFLDNVLDRRPVFHQEPTHYRYPGLPDVEFFDTAYRELRDRLRDALPAIRGEFEALARSHPRDQRPYVDFAAGQPVGQWSALNRSTDWNVYHLIRYGELDPDLTRVCPATVAAFSGAEQASIPGLGPNLMFSLLAPHTHIPPHHGVANFRVVCHLPLIVPPNCRFRVGADTREWTPGEAWIFDDTIEHEAWNDSDALRVVLIGDLWRPELDAQDRSIVADFMQAQAQALGSDLGAL